jgi:hypothetical protein
MFAGDESAAARVDVVRVSATGGLVRRRWADGLWDVALPGGRYAVTGPHKGYIRRHATLNRIPTPRRSRQIGGKTYCW